MSDKLLQKIKVAVAAENKAYEAHMTSYEELHSRSKALGLLLLEAKKLHPAVKDFEAYLDKVDGIHLTRAYECMKLAKGRTTEAKLRKKGRDRVKKHRAKKKSAAKKEPVKLAGNDIDVDALGPAARAQLDDALNGKKQAEIDAAFGAALDDAVEKAEAKPAKDSVTVTESPERIRDSERALREFQVACKTYLPKLIDADMEKAVAHVDVFASARRLAGAIKTKKAAAPAKSGGQFQSLPAPDHTKEAVGAPACLTAYAAHEPPKGQLLFSGTLRGLRTLGSKKKKAA